MNKFKKKSPNTYINISIYLVKNNPIFYSIIDRAIIKLNLIKDRN